MIKIYVLNHPEGKGLLRRKYMEESLSRENIEFEFVETIKPSINKIPFKGETQIIDFIDKTNQIKLWKKNNYLFVVCFLSINK